MLQDINYSRSLPVPTTFWPGCFGDRMDTAIRRNHGRQLRLDHAEPAQVLQAIDELEADLHLPIAPQF